MENELSNLLTGGASVAFLLAFLIFSLIGQLISLLLHWKIKRAKKEPFNWKFWWKDNWVRLTLGLLIPPLIVVFFSDLEFVLGKVFERFGAQYRLTTLLGFFVGLFMDIVILSIKKLSKLNPLSNGN